MNAVYNLVRCSDGKNRIQFSGRLPLSGGHVERVAVDAPPYGRRDYFHGGECSALSEENWLSGNPASGVR